MCIRDRYKIIGLCAKSNIRLIMGERDMINKVFHRIVAGTAVVAMGLSLLVTAIPINASVTVKLNKSNLNMTEGSKKTIKVKGKKIKKVTWKSTKKKVASVKKKKAASAVITAKKKGKTVIKATVKMLSLIHIFLEESLSHILQQAVRRAIQ